ILFGKRIRISNSDWLLLFGLVFLLFSQSFIKDIGIIIIDFRFYFGWVVFYFLFKVLVVREDALSKVLVPLCIMTLVEAALINTVIHASVLPNFPHIDAPVSDFVSAGNYQRPYSFGASATVGSSLLVVLLAITKIQGWRFLLVVTTVFVFLSGTGLAILFLFLLVMHRKFAIQMSLLIFLSVLLFGSIFHDEVQSVINAYNDRIGFDYIDFLIDFKLSQIQEHFAGMEWYMFITGGLGEYRGGDFGFLAFFLANGIIGFLLILLVILSNINRNNAFPLILLVLSSFHYPVMFFLPGQMIFGLLLSMPRRIQA
ncbi:MAG: hypothetical protein Q8O31_04065, partial [Rhodocyclaceae bacterium]|nr:hypothetical protein [Rhodocyclaceae bacterium]